MAVEDFAVFARNSRTLLYSRWQSGLACAININPRTALVACVLIGLMVPTDAFSVEKNKTYRIFVQPSWVASSKLAMSPEGNLIFRRYAYREDLNFFPNLMLFTCQSDPAKLNYITIIVPKDYKIKSMARNMANPNLSVRLLVDGKTTYTLAGDYNSGEIAIDRTPENSNKFDSIMDASELSIGFGIGDVFDFYLPPNMDAFLKEASVAVGLFADVVGDVTFVNRETAYNMCAQFQKAKHE